MTTSRTAPAVALFVAGISLASVTARADDAMSDFNYLFTEAVEAQRWRADLIRVDGDHRPSRAQRLATGTSRVVGGALGAAANATLGAAVLGLGGVADSLQPTYSKEESVEAKFEIDGREHRGTAKIEQRKMGGLVITAVAAAAGAGVSMLGVTPDQWAGWVQPVTHYVSLAHPSLVKSAPLWGAATAATAAVTMRTAMAATVGAVYGGYHGAKIGAKAAGRKVAQVFARRGR